MIIQEAPGQYASEVLSLEEGVRARCGVTGTPIFIPQSYCNLQIVAYEREIYDSV